MIVVPTAILIQPSLQGAQGQAWQDTMPPQFQRPKRSLHFSIEIRCPHAASHMVNSPIFECCMEAATELAAVVGDQELRLAVLFYCTFHESEHRGSFRHSAINPQGQQFAGEAIQNRGYVKSEPEYPGACKVHVSDVIRMLRQQQMMRRGSGRLFHRGLSFLFRRRLWLCRFGFMQKSLDA